MKHKFDYKLRDGSTITKIRNIWTTEQPGNISRVTFIAAETDAKQVVLCSRGPAKDNLGRIVKNTHTHD